ITKVIDFQIRKNPSFDLVLGQEWLWMHEAKISFEFFPEAHSHNAKIVIDGMSIPLIDKDFNINSFTKNNSSNSAKSKAGLTKDEITNMINKILSDAENNKRRKRHHGNISPVSQIHRRTSRIKKYPKIDLGDGGGKLLWVKSDSLDTSDSSDSSSSRLQLEVIDT
ncbi:219_t:CDS:2, partial [Diversispora eburnea]